MAATSGEPPGTFGAWGLGFRVGLGVGFNSCLQPTSTPSTAHASLLHPLMSCWEAALCRSPLPALGGFFAAAATSRAPAWASKAGQQPARSSVEDPLAHPPAGWWQAPRQSVWTAWGRTLGAERLGQNTRQGTEGSLEGDQSLGAGMRTLRSERSWWARRASCTWAWVSLVVKRALATVRVA